MKISTKRCWSYIIDMIILGIIIFLISLAFPTNPYEEELSKKNEQYMNHLITQEEYHTSHIQLLHQIDKQNVGFNVLTTSILVIWFIIIPLLNNGQTVGQKIMKLQTVSDSELTLESLVGRCVVIGGLGYLLFMFVILYLTSDQVYYILINFFAFFQIIVATVHGFMVLYRKDYLGLADILTKTRIEEIK